MRPEPTDARIIEEACSRPIAFAEIFDRHYDALRDYLARRLPAALAEELAAESFLIAFERRRDYDLAFPSARPWLFGIATNLLGRHRRDERRRIAAYARSLPGSRVEAPDEIASRLDAAQMRTALARAIGDLEPGDRDALLLQTLAELTYPEVARALGIPAGTVKSRLHRARTQLASALQPEGAKSDG
jgi:RNA polymerase sigma-70 factor (ECF subfamily)